MSYKDKKIREKLFSTSLGRLLIFAYDRPQLSLDKRRALVEAISKGGSLGNHYQKHTLQTPYSLNYQYTRQGILRVCLDKMISFPETTENLRTSICKIAALSAWARTNPNRTQDIFNRFAEEMCPEDYRQNPGLPVTDNISRNFHKSLKEKLGNRLGGEEVLDFIIYSPNNFYKKYRER